MTGILKIQENIEGTDRLVNWNIRTAVEAAFGKTDFNEALDAAFAATAAAREKGTRVHAGVESVILDKDEFPLNLSDGLAMFHWMRFLHREKPEIHATEQMVINLTAGYGGTFDLDATVRGKRALIDVKTGKVKDIAGLQLAAYAGGEWMGQPDDPEKYPLPEFEAYYVLALSDEGYELVPMTVGKEEVDHFLYLVETHHRLKAWASKEKSEAAAA